ncbi:hypothetical protein, partial [Nostoc sp. FACHB-888]|uniref:hypothetical protein n=1 Tax=Nostoc sp. FACHB-888 TaxID=2692842 RepID=UPI001A7EB3B1
MSLSNTINCIDVFVICCAGGYEGFKVFDKPTPTPAFKYAKVAWVNNGDIHKILRSLSYHVWLISYSYHICAKIGKPSFSPAPCGLNDKSLIGFLKSSINSFTFNFLSTTASIAFSARNNLRSSQGLWTVTQSFDEILLERFYLLF